MRLSYKGTNFSGWQRQSNAHTVQEEIEDAFELLFRKKIHIIGCGRTDSGVHARNYIAHFDLDNPLDFDLLFKLNHIMSKDITIHEILPVSIQSHSRFDANRRTYDYFIKGDKDSFNAEFAFAYPMIHKLNVEELNKAASLLLKYNDFFTFCKKKTDVKTTICQIYKSEWRWISEDTLHFTISANRFLRGMVRLVVGMCINVSLGKLDILEVEEALKAKRRLERDWSVHAQGLALSSIDYPYPVSKQESVISVREGSPDELVTLSAKIPELVDPYGVEEYNLRLKNIPSLILVASKGSHLVGFKVGYQREADGSFYSWMGGVLPSYRRLGVADKLADAQDDWAKQKGYTSIKMKTQFRLKAMQKFAMKRAFEILTIEHTKPRENSIIWLEKKLH